MDVQQAMINDRKQKGTNACRIFLQDDSRNFVKSDRILNFVPLNGIRDRFGIEELDW